MRWPTPWKRCIAKSAVGRAVVSQRGSLVRGALLDLREVGATTEEMMAGVAREGVARTITTPAMDVRVGVARASVVVIVVPIEELVASVAQGAQGVRLAIEASRASVQAIARAVLNLGHREKSGLTNDGW